MNVLLLVNDETTVESRWNGKKWEYPVDIKVGPLRWRPVAKAAD